MLFSIFTPTHKPSHLQEAYKSLRLQGDVPWEWVISPNGEAIGNLHKDVVKDPRVKVVPYHLKEGEKPKIGALKRFACDHATGDVFVELDHDDMLVPGILEKIGHAVEKGAGFIYSDAAVFIDKKEAVWPVGYSELFGWETYELRIFGRDLLATRAFDPVPRALCEVYYAPDHVRCWTRKAYYAAGGHNKELTVGDDHDLVCRTYLAKQEFCHLETCGYLYRNHPGNTVKSHNDEIQVQQAKNRDKYLYQLLDEWVRRNGYTYFDMNFRNPKVKITSVGGLRIKARTSSIASIRCFDMLQFVAQDKVMDAMAEIYRVLMPGGWACIAVPSALYPGGFAPHYRSHWSEHTFEYFTNWKFAQTIGLRKPKARFQKVRCFSAHPRSDYAKLGIKYVYADLCAIKGQRQPGRVTI